jgi:hypothetical protein
MGSNGVLHSQDTPQEAYQCPFSHFYMDGKESLTRYVIVVCRNRCWIRHQTTKTIEKQHCELCGLRNQ